MSIPAFLAVVVALTTFANVSAEERMYPPRGTPKELENRVGLKYGYSWPKLVVDKQDHGYVVKAEMGGDPYLTWVTATKFALWHCSNANTTPKECKWSTFDLKTKTVTQIELVGFDSTNAAVAFYKSKMAYAGKLPNGNLGCFLYDWESGKFLGSADTKIKYVSTGAWYSDRASFQDGGSKVICSQVEEWKSSESVEGGDSYPIPKYKSVFEREIK